MDCKDWTTILRLKYHNTKSFTYKENEVEEDNQKLDNFCCTFHILPTTIEEKILICN